MLLRAVKQFREGRQKGKQIFKRQNLRSKYRPTCSSSASGIGTEAICKTSR